MILKILATMLVVNGVVATVLLITMIVEAWQGKCYSR